MTELPDYFKVEPYDRYDKSIKVTGPDELLLEVDFDDVNHEQVEFLTQKLATVLNDNWTTYPSGP